MAWTLCPIHGEELEPDVTGRAGFSAPIVGELINDIETQSSEVVSVRSWLARLEVSCRPRLLYLDAQTLALCLDDDPKDILTVLGPVLHGVRHQLAHDQSSVIASSSERPGRQRIVQCRPRQEGGFGCRWEDHFTADGWGLSDGTAFLGSLTQAAQRKSTQRL